MTVSSSCNVGRGSRRWSWRDPHVPEPHPSIGRLTDPVPGFDAEEERERVRDRHRFGVAYLPRTLSRLRDDPAWPGTLAELRDLGSKTSTC